MNKEKQLVSKTELKNALSEHLPYELQMLDHTARRLADADLFVLDWNAHFESFCIHARLIEAFLSGSDDNRNFRAADFVEGHRGSTPAKVKSTIDRLNSQTFHLGKARAKSKKLKVNIDDAGMVAACLREKMLEFVDALPGDLRAAWDRPEPELTKLGVHEPPGVVGSDATPTHRGITGPDRPSSSSS